VNDHLPAEDLDFDVVYPPTIRALSRRFWTPVGVARRAAELFRRAGVHLVLDVGSGVGKFALVAAGAAPNVRFVGIEQRGHLVEIAARAKAFLALPNTTFIQGDVSRAALGGYQGFYFFNPFAENLFNEGEYIDRTVSLSSERFFGDVLRVERALRDAPVGTALVTYHGLSGRVPASYELCASEPAGSDWLRLWRQRGDEREGFFLEFGNEVTLHRPDGSPA
jgi:SAM-dependent methyltransferase